MKDNGFNNYRKNKVEYINKIDIKEFLGEEYKNQKGIAKKPMTLDDLKEEFKKFDGDYIHICEQFDEFSERDKKLFILYSFFHFGLKYYREDIDIISTDELLSKVDNLAKEFASLGSYTGCNLGFCKGLDGIYLRGYGWNCSIPIQVKFALKDIDEISLQDLAKFSNKGYTAEDEEAKIFEMLNEKKQNEYSAFCDVIFKIIEGKRK